MVDAYLVCIGQMEQHLVDKDYIEFPDGAKDVKEALEEDVNINVETVNISSPEVTIEKTHKEVDEVAPETVVEPVTTDPLEQSDLEKLAQVKDAVKKDDFEEFEYFTDFPEPVKEEDED